jgi:hypothetical protein
LIGDGRVAVEFTLVDHVGDHRGGYRARTYRVDADAAGCVLECGAARQAEHTVLGRVASHGAI